MTFLYPQPRCMRPIISGAATLNAGVSAGSATPVTGYPGRFTITSTAAIGTPRIVVTDQTIWEVPSLVDVMGRSIDDSDDLDIDDIFRVFGWFDSTTAPTDRVFTWGISQGSVSSSSPGLAGHAVCVAGNWRMYHSGCTGAGWGTPVAAVTDSSSTRGGCMQAHVGTASAQSRMNVFAMAAGGTLVTTANTMTSPQQNTSSQDFDRMFFGVGQLLGVGGSSDTHDYGLTGVFLRLAILDLFPF